MREQTTPSVPVVPSGMFRFGKGSLAVLASLLASVLPLPAAAAASGVALEAARVVRTYFGLRQDAPPEGDPCLHRAAALLGESMGAGDPGPAAFHAFLRHALRLSGCSDVGVVAAVLGLDGDQGTDARIGRLVEPLLTAGFPVTHFGVAPHPTPGHATVVLAHRAIEIEPSPLPATAAPGSSLDLRGRVAAGHRNPRFLYTAPDGRVRLGRQRWTGDGFEVVVPLGRSPGRYRLQVMVDGPFGPEEAMAWTVWAGEVPPALPTVPVAPAGPTPSPEEAEEAAEELLIRERIAHGLPAVRVDPALAAAARAHARDLFERRQFGHVTPEGGRPEDRLRVRGGSFGRVLENVAMAATVQEAHSALLDSPSHRHNLLSREVEAVGMGVAFDPGGSRLCLVQLFGARAMEAPLVVAARVLEALRAARHAAGLPLPAVHREAEAVAAEVVARSAREGRAPWSAMAGPPTTSTKDGNPGTPSGMDVEVVAAADVEEAVALLLEEGRWRARWRVMGVEAAAGTLGQEGPSIFWVAVAWGT